MEIEKGELRVENGGLIRISILNSQFPISKRFRHARSATQLRMLRQRSAGRLDRRGDLHLRMYVLSHVCERFAEGPVPKLWWRACHATATTGCGTRKISGVDAARIQT
jgi:hypothetical protein